MDQKTVRTVDQILMADWYARNNVGWKEFSETLYPTEQDEDYIELKWKQFRQGNLYSKLDAENRNKYTKGFLEPRF